MIQAKNLYKTHNLELLAIIKALKTWYHYLKGFLFEVITLIKHNNFCQFMNTLCLSSKPVWWAQKLSRYNFQADYHQNTANIAIDALFCFGQKTYAEKKAF